MTLEDIVKGPRQVTADYHTAAARLWKRYGLRDQKPTPLVYAAFEYRCAVERVVLELYAIMRRADSKLPHPSNIGTFSGVVARLHEVAGGDGKVLFRVLTFNRILAEIVGLDKPLSIPSPGKLHGFWSKLSEYCHRQLIPDETWESTSWIQKGYDLLDQVDSYLQEILLDQHFGAFPEDKMPAEVLEARNTFVGEQIDEPTLRTRLILMRPVLEERFRTRGGT